MSENNLAVPSWDQVDHGPLTEMDYQILKASMPTYRDILIVKTLRSTGLRISEVLSITSQQKSHHGLSHILYIKRAKKRGEEAEQVDLVFLPADLGVELDAYIKEHFRKPAEPVFQGSRPGARLTNRAVEYIFRKASIQCGRPVHPHMLRSFFSNDLMNRGCTVQEASKMLGHSNIKTTLDHYHQLTTDRRRQIGEGIIP